MMACKGNACNLPLMEERTDAHRHFSCTRFSITIVSPVRVTLRATMKSGAKTWLIHALSFDGPCSSRGLHLLRHDAQSSPCPHNRHIFARSVHVAGREHYTAQESRWLLRNTAGSVTVSRATLVNYSSPRTGGQRNKSPLHRMSYCGFWGACKFGVLSRRLTVVKVAHACIFYHELNQTGGAHLLFETLRS
ncbi:uncharacterized protein LAESUDRAFT_547168 [Laetiporus sulphureus 93-53]|uniref:Uncharacterized protein n=1 Tax=Laetiporus sulphureus 93-53 TaxID=1314785 RepID=A0A165FPX0_9APHY|nr:uncharacterized protein LAESUDRAFT_547168 [Laetiporus sulphureus 93-53]KZT09297.1 hypothetical protein LAESUDRAFT_547168 [Laetiporus sulphureus 93-53]